MLESPDPKQRLAAVPVVRAMPPAKGIPLLRRLIADPNQEVRRAGVDAIEDVTFKNKADRNDKANDKGEAIKLYKPLVNDADVVVRAKAQGQLSKLVDTKPPAPPEPKPVVVAVQDPPPPPPPPADEVLPAVQQALDVAKAADKDVKPALEELDKQLAEAGTKLSEEREGKLRDEITKTLAGLEGLANKAEAGAKAATTAAGATPTPLNQKALDDTAKLVARVRDAAKDARKKADEPLKQMKEGKDIIDESEKRTLITAAETDLEIGNLAAAKAKLDKVGSSSNPQFHLLYGRFYEEKAGKTADAAAKRKLLQQALSSYKRSSSPKAKAKVAELTKTLATP
jgi:hypothetical protein